MKKNFKRWIALLLALVLVSANAVYTAGTSLIATQGDVGETVEQTVGTTAAGTTGDTPTDNGGTENTTEELNLPEQPATGDGDQQTQQQSEEPAQAEQETVTYQITINQPDVEGGVIKTWTTGEPADITYDDNNQHIEEINEGEKLYFSITPDETHTIKAVKDQDGNEIEAKEQEDTTFKYEVIANKAQTFTVEYDEVKVEEPAEEVKEEKKEEVTPEAQISLFSLFADEPEAQAVEEEIQYEATKEVIAGKDVKLDPSGSGRYNWEIVEGSEFVSLSDNTSNKRTMYVTGKQEGTAVVKASRNNGNTVLYYQVIVKASKNAYHYIASSDSMNADLYYCINGGSLTLLPVGSSVTLSNPKYNVISFYVRVKDGYASGTSFKHRNGSTEGACSGANYNDGTYTDINNAPAAIKSASGTVYNISGANSDALDIGCVKQFHYTQVSHGMEWREFRISGNPVQVKVKYELNGGSGNISDNNIYVHSNVTGVTYSNSIKVSDVIPTKENADFAGWQLDVNGVRYEGGANISIDAIWRAIADGLNGAQEKIITLNALWNDQVTVAYDGNGSTAGSVADGNSYSLDEEVTVKENSFRKLNYYFTGWNTEANGSGTAYQPGDTFSIKGNTTLYAQWASKKGATINYVALGNGGTVSASQEVVGADESTSQGSTVTTNAGYTFEGWYADRECTEKVSSENKFAPSRAEGETWGTGNVYTYYAKFQEKAVTVGYNLSLEGATWSGGTPDNLSENGTTSSGAPKYKENIKYSKGETYTVISNVPTCDGYVFVGWLDKERSTTHPSSIVKDGAKVAIDDDNQYTFDAIWVSIGASGVTKVYDGNAYSISASSQFNQGKLADKYMDQAKAHVTFGQMTYQYSEDGGTTWKDNGTVNPTFTNVGVYKVKATQTVTINGNASGSAVQMFDIGETIPSISAEATVTITARPVTINVANKTKAFGEADPEFTGKVEGLVNVDDLGNVSYARIADDASKENVGDDITLTATYTENPNYDVTVRNGKLKIKAAQITDTERFTVTQPANVVYNGQSQIQSVVVTDTKTGKQLVVDKDCTISYSEDTINVGTVTITVVGKGNYAGTVTRTYEITSKPVTITVDKAEKIFGDADPEFTGNVEGLVNVDDLGKVSYVRIANDATKENITDDITLTATYTENKNYSVSVTTNKLVIKAATNNGLKVKALTTVYDGDAHTIETPEALKAGTTILYSTTENGEFTETKPEYTDADEYTIYVKGTNPNYADTEVYPATIKITKRPVTVSVETDEFDYDGKEHSVSYSVSEAGKNTGLLSNHKETVTLENASRTNEGTNTVTVKDVKIGVTQNALESVVSFFTGADTDVTKNYDIATESGSITVKAATITDDKRFTVTQPENVVYNGQSQKQSVVVTDKTTGKELVENTDCTISYSEDTTNVGTVTVTITGKDNYAGTVTRTYEITAKPVTITVDSTEKVYGTEDPEFTGKVVGLVKDGDLGTVSYVREAGDVSKENVGDSVTLTATYEANDNYDITITHGTVTITARPLTITAASASKTFDNTALTATSAAITDGTLADGQEVTSVTVVGSQTEVGTSANVASNLVVMADGVDVTSNYDISYVDGTLTVTAAPVNPVTPTPVVPTPTPVTPTPVTPAPETTPTVVTPEGATDAGTAEPVVNTPAGYDLTSVADNQTPLANTNLEEHDCCVLHFLLMLLAFIVTACYTKSMKNRQKRIFELREMLEIEQAKKLNDEEDGADIA